MDKDMKDMLIRVHTLGQECVIDYLKEEMNRLLDAYKDKKDGTDLLLDIINVLSHCKVDQDKAVKLK